MILSGLHVCEACENVKDCSRSRVTSATGESPKSGPPLLAFRAILFRIHSTDRDPAFWGRTGNNGFDAPAGEFGVLYASQDQYEAFVESYGDALGRIITTTSLAQRAWARVEPTRDLRLIDLSGSGLAKIGADERLCSGEHDVAQQWSLALWRHPAAVDGIHYRARHDPSRMSVALFDRSNSAVSVVKEGGLLDDRHKALLAAILETYQFSLL
jgi:hypothetical protein